MWQSQTLIKRPFHWSCIQYYFLFIWNHFYFQYIPKIILYLLNCFETRKSNPSVISLISVIPITSVNFSSLFKKEDCIQRRLQVWEIYLFVSLHYKENEAKVSQIKCNSCCQWNVITWKIWTVGLAADDIII